MNELVKEGLIDIHCHLLPGVDDGCVDVEETIACIRELKKVGFVGSICTPHAGAGFGTIVNDDLVNHWVADLRDELKAAGVEYQLWAGAEIALCKDSIQWMKDHGVMTLADSKCVLVDLWVERWEKWIDPIFEWLLEEGYQPILAHPERIPCGEELNGRILALEGMGVWLQGNFQCMTGEAGYRPDLMIRQLLLEDRYQFLGMDVHRLITLGGRIDGLQMVEVEFGRPRIEQLAGCAPRKQILN